MAAKLWWQVVQLVSCLSLLSVLAWHLSYQQKTTTVDETLPQNYDLTWTDAIQGNRENMRNSTDKIAPQSPEEPSSSVADTISEYDSEPPSKEGPSGVFVLGMHHSGTSLLTLLLMQLGLESGGRENLMILNDNPVKYFELARAVHNDENFIAHADNHWNPPWPGYGYEWQKATSELQKSFTAEVNRTVDFLESKTGADRSWLLKDPRLCIVADHYFRAMPAHRKPICVLAIREPIELVSRFTRFVQEWPVQASSELWEEYTTRAIESCRRFGVVHLINNHGFMMEHPYEAAIELYHKLHDLGVQGIYLPDREKFEHDFLRLWYRGPSRDSPKKNLTIEEMAVKFHVEPQMIRAVKDSLTPRAKKLWEKFENDDLDSLTDEELLPSSWTIGSPQARYKRTP